MQIVVDKQVRTSSVHVRGDTFIFRQHRPAASETVIDLIHGFGHL